jgi:cytochrome c553
MSVRRTTRETTSKALRRTRAAGASLAAGAAGLARRGAGTGVAAVATWLAARAAGLAASALLAAGGVAASPRYTDLRNIEPIHGDAAAGAKKTTVCVSCHGVDGVSVAPTFPRLAGQREDYLYHRLFSFRHAGAKDPYYSVSPMTSIAATLSDADMRDLAAYFASQTPRVPDAPAVTAQPGESLFLNGNPARGIPPCQGCHGVDADGPSRVSDQYAAYPALRGQYPLYVAARLTHYRTGQPADTSNTFIMHGVAATLDDDSIQALANWLGSLPPRKSL